MHFPCLESLDKTWESEERIWRQSSNLSFLLKKNEWTRNPKLEGIQFWEEMEIPMWNREERRESWKRKSATKPLKMISSWFWEDWNKFERKWRAFCLNWVKKWEKTLSLSQSLLMFWRREDKREGRRGIEVREEERKRIKLFGEEKEFCLLYLQSLCEWFENTFCFSHSLFSLLPKSSSSFSSPLHTKTRRRREQNTS